MYWKITWAIKWKSACKQLLLWGVANVKGYTQVQKVENPSKDIKHKKGPLAGSDTLPNWSALKPQSEHGEQKNKWINSTTETLENFSNYPS